MVVVVVVQLCKLSSHEKDETMFDTWNIHRFQLTSLRLTSSRTVLMSIPPTLDTEQVYTPALVTCRLMTSNADLPVLLMILLSPPRINTFPSFSQQMCGSGTPVKVHTSSKCIPSVLVSDAGRSIMVGRAVLWRRKGKHCARIWAGGRRWGRGSNLHIE